MIYHVNAYGLVILDEDVETTANALESEAAEKAAAEAKAKAEEEKNAGR